jgi:hypothetical protein
MFKFLTDISKINFSIIGLTIFFSGLALVIVIAINNFLDYCIRDFYGKKSEYPHIIRIINGYGAGFLFAFVIAFIFCQYGNQFGKLNRFISLFIITAGYLKFKYLKYRLFKN